MEREGQQYFEAVAGEGEEDYNQILLATESQEKESLSKRETMQGVISFQSDLIEALTHPKVSIFPKNLPRLTEEKKLFLTLLASSVKTLMEILPLEMHGRGRQSTGLSFELKKRLAIAMEISFLVVRCNSKNVC